MNLLKPKVELLGDPRGVNNYYLMASLIELCGRVAYKSEDKIEEGSSEKFIDMLQSKKHLSPMEHGTVYIKVPKTIWSTKWGLDASVLKNNAYSKCNGTSNSYCFTTNWRVILENRLLSFTEQFRSGYEESFEPRITFKIICSRGTSHELVRHRGFSFTQESTRYCNYTKDKFGSEISYIIPSWFQNVTEGIMYAPYLTVSDTLTNAERQFLKILIDAENAYMNLIEDGCTPQQARELLPMALKTEIVMTGTLTQWKDFLSLRSSKYGAKGMHPDMDVIANMIYDKLVKDKYIEEKS